MQRFALTFTTMLASFSCASATVHAQQARGVALADQSTGADMCVKLRAAIRGALAANAAGGNLKPTVVDATRFAGIQACSVNPFEAVAPAPTYVPLTVHLGAVVLQTSVPWRIANPGITLAGESPQSTWIEYTGSAPISAVLTLESPNYNGGSDTGPKGDLFGTDLKDLSVIGNRQATDDIYAAAWHHSELRDLDTWGGTTCGVHTFFAVTDTFLRLHTSGNDAGQWGFPGEAPAHGLCLDGTTAARTTDGTVLDAMAEGVTGAGWWLPMANNMTFTSGTSENNAGGLAIGYPSTANTFVDPDFEGNSAYNIQENGADTLLMNPIMDAKPLDIGPKSVFFAMYNGNETAPVHVADGAQYPGICYGSVCRAPVAGKLQVQDALTNSSGLEIASAAGCKLPGGKTLGATCTTTVPLPVAMANTDYHPYCSLEGVTGVVIGPVIAKTKRSLDVQTVLMERDTVGGGTVSCWVGTNG